ncbi:CpaE family protein [Erythrobacter sp. MTPC3]|uniref:AAA family ATPase n=1 Tax=Erythrobacter sp. MTPC3 TaxID=3056564 RepID=UPI0036F1D4BC
MIEFAYQMPKPETVATGDIMVVEVNPDDPVSMNWLSELKAIAPGSPLIAGVAELDIAKTRALLKRGVDDVLKIPFSIDEFLGALADVDQQALTKMPNVAHRAPLVACLGSSGGIGTTTVATHLAAAWQTDGSSATVLDLDLQQGDASSYLGYSHSLTLQDLLDADKRLDAEIFTSVLAKKPGAPSIVLAPDDILPIEEINFDRLSPIFEAAQAQTDLVVLDMPVCLTNWGLSALFACDKIVLVGALSVHSLRKVRRQLDFLVSMGIARANILIVLNRASSGLFKPIKVDEAADALKHSVFAVLPDEPAPLSEAQDRGEFVWEVSKRGKLSKAFYALADDLHSILDEGICRCGRLIASRKKPSFRATTKARKSRQAKTLPCCCTRHQTSAMNACSKSRWRSTRVCWTRSICRCSTSCRRIRSSRRLAASSLNCSPNSIIRSTATKGPLLSRM